MGSHIIDSYFFSDQYSTKEMRDIFNDENMIQKWLDVEAALAEAEAELGIIPNEAGEEIRKKAKVGLIDFGEIKNNLEQNGHPMVSFLRVFKTVCRKDAGEYVHWGATTQDIIDTGMILQVKEAYSEITAKMFELDELVLGSAKKYKKLVMAGRTHGQHALPITLGFKFAVWASEISRSCERLTECSKRLFIGQFSGAVGTIASLGKEGIMVQELMMKKLDLGIPKITWHTSRDCIAEFISVLGIITSTIGKMANEIVNMQKTEYSELEEPFFMGKIGSSTMPHKRNPMMCENIVALSKIVRSNVPLAIEVMICEHERDMRSWQTEWEFVGKVCCMTDAALKMMITVVKGLIVYPENIKRNLYLLKGLMLSEAIMMKLGNRIGRQAAHEIVYKICMDAFNHDIQISEALMENSMISSNFSKAEIDLLLNPNNYIGLAEDFVDRVAKT